MKLATTIVALFLGNLVPGVQSYRNHIQRALSEALEALDLDLELELEYDLEFLDDSPIHQRRAEQTVTNQCVDDQMLLIDDDRDIFEDRFESAGCVEIGRTEDGMGILHTYGDCPLIESTYRSFCETNYQYVKHRDMKLSCDIKIVANETIQFESVLDLVFLNTALCEPVSCPSDGNAWTSDDYNVVYEFVSLNCGCGYTHANCTHEFLEEEEHSDSHDEMAMSTDKVEEEDAHSKDHDSHDGHDHGSHDDEGETEATMMSGGVSALTSSAAAAAAVMGVVTALW